MLRSQLNQQSLLLNSSIKAVVQVKHFGVVLYMKQEKTGDFGLNCPASFGVLSNKYCRDNKCLYQILETK